MKLKDYQQEALDVFTEYLSLLRTKQNEADAAQAAFEALPEAVREPLRASFRPADPLIDTWTALPQMPHGAVRSVWTDLKDGTNASIPNVCLKLPTGGGKTLLAAHGVEHLQVDWLQRQSGLVLWIVPSEAIYSQTLKALKDRESALRQVLDRASAGRTRILEKGDSFTRADLDSRLCVMVLMLQAARRVDESVLRMFRGGGDASFFPDETNKAAIDAARAATSNLDVYDLGDSAMVGSVKRTLANVLRIVRPVVVLDEAHNAASELGRKTLAKLNPAFILELTATPTPLSNVLVDVQGLALRDEEMIKLPINVAVDVRGRWQDTLRAALDKLNALDVAAQDHRAASGDYIRPIMIVRVDFTGEKQRDRPIHVEDAIEWLIEQGGIDPSAIRRQTAEKKQLGDEDLLSDRSGVRVVVTKDALREGWDCPFAYVLAILSSGGGSTALKQFIGRVLRQPYARRTDYLADGVSLDESYVFCADRSVGEAVRHINAGLLDQGMGDLQSAVRMTSLGEEATTAARIPIRRTEGFKGRRILLPRVLHADAAQADGWRDLDYDSDLLGAMDWGAIHWIGADTYQLAEDRSRREARRVDLDAQGALADAATTAPMAPATALLDRVDLIRRLSETIPNPWQADRVLTDALTTLRTRGLTDDELATGRLSLAASMSEDLRRTVEAAAEAVFRRKIGEGMISFRLTEPALPPELTAALAGDNVNAVQRGDMTPLLKALYTPVLQSEVNGLERDVALYLDETEAVGWWWRVAARRDPWGLQGWRPHKVYPDFLIALDDDGRTARLLALETKGSHLDGSDTPYKASLFRALETSYSGGAVVGQVEAFDDAPDAVHFEIVFGGDGTEAWRSKIAAALAR